jgi:excisionase family DNA binding protein
MGISARTLWAMTATGEIPHVRLGRAVLYPVADLANWLSERAAKGVSQ